MLWEIRSSVAYFDELRERDREERVEEEQIDLHQCRYRLPAGVLRPFDSDSGLRGSKGGRGRVCMLCQ